MDKGVDIISPSEPHAARPQLTKAIAKLWEHTINIGPHAGVSDFDKKRVRLINGIS